MEKLDHPEHRRQRASIAAALIVSAGLGVFAFAPAIGNKFVYDDYPIIVENATVNQPGPWYRFWQEPYWPRHVSSDKLYRPLTLWSFRANLVLFGKAKVNPEDARAFHAVNVALHALTCAGVALLAWRTIRQPWVPWVAGALFATHPLHTEAVVTCVGRSELLAGLFGVCLMARYINPGRGSRPEIQSPQEGTIRGLPGARPWFHVLNALLLLLAMMSKEHGVFVWPALIFYDLWRYRRMQTAGRTARREWLNNTAAPAHLGFILATTLFFMLRFSVFGQHYRLDAHGVRNWESPVAHATFIEHLLTPFRLLWLTLKLVVWPRALCPIWSVTVLKLPRELAPDVIAGMLTLLLLLTIAIFAWRRGSLLAPLLLGLLVLLAIPLQALPMAHWLYAERWLYLPSVLMAVLVTALLVRVPAAGWAFGLTAAMILLPASWQYASRFRDNLTMNKTVVARQPDNFHGWRNLAVLHHLRGEHRAAIEDAREIIERFGPVVADPYYVLVKSHIALGEGREALEALNTYEWILRDAVMSGLEGDRQRAEELIARQAQSRPATSAAAGS